MSSINTSSDDERPEKPVVERKSVGVQIQEPPADLHYARHNVVDYALFLCRGRKSPREISNLYETEGDHAKSDTRLVVLDESGKCWKIWANVFFQQHNCWSHSIATMEFDEHVRTLSARTPADGGPHVRLV